MTEPERLAEQQVQPKVDEWANQVRMQMAAKGGVALAQVSQPTSEEEAKEEPETQKKNETFNGLEAINLIVKTVNYKNVDNWKN